MPLAPGGSTAVSSTSGGKVYAFNSIGTIPGQVIGQNPSRSSLTFHNPGSVDIFIAPVNDANNVPLVPSLSSLGGCFRVFGNGGTLVITGECQKPWQAFAASGSGNPLTVMESNV